MRIKESKKIFIGVVAVLIVVLIALLASPFSPLQASEDNGWLSFDFGKSEQKEDQEQVENAKNSQDTKIEETTNTNDPQDPEDSKELGAEWLKDVEINTLNWSKYVSEDGRFSFKYPERVDNFNSSAPSVESAPALYTLHGQYGMNYTAEFGGYYLSKEHVELLTNTEYDRFGNTHFESRIGAFVMVTDQISKQAAKDLLLQQEGGSIESESVQIGDYKFDIINAFWNSNLETGRHYIAETPDGRLIYLHTNVSTAKQNPVAIHEQLSDLYFEALLNSIDLR